MLQPKQYPEMLGKALVLEAEPFITMVDDDNPWAEGLFMVVVVGVLVGIAQVLSVLLTAAVMPHPDALYAAVVQLTNDLSQVLTPGMAGGSEVAEWMRNSVLPGTRFFGLTWSWLQLGWLVLAPFLLVLLWFIYGIITHFISRALGGEGRLTQTLGAVALMVAPQIFVLFQIIPFASVSTLLLWVWTLLIVYRAVEVVHNLSWRKAAGVAVAAPAMFIILLTAGTAIITVSAGIAGGL